MKRAVPIEQYEAAQDCLMKVLLGTFMRQSQVIQAAVDKAVEKGIITVAKEDGETRLSVKEWTLMNRHIADQSYLQRLFVKVGLAKGPSPTQHQFNVQARVIAYLKQWGGIDARTAQTLGTTDARKIFTRLRKKGLLHPANDPRGYVSLPNASGQGCYRWHRWTGKQ